MSRRALPALIAILAVATLGAPRAAAAAMATKTVEQTVAANGQVKIANLAGRVELVPAGAGPVKVVAVVNAEGASPEETRELMAAMRFVQEPDGTWDLAYPVDRYDAFVYPQGLKQIGNSTTAKYRGQRVRVYGGPRGGAPVLYADLTITVPKGADVKVTDSVGLIRGQTLSANLALVTGSGDIRLNGVAGALSVDTGSGDVDLRQIAGSTKADTGSGDVVVEGIAGDSLKIDTGSGDVTVARATVRDLVADTGSGDIEVKGTKLETFVGDTGSGDVRVEGDLAGARKIDVDTGSGDVVLVGGPGFEFDLTTDVGSGDVSVAYSDAELRRNHHEIVGARRGSGHTVVMVDTGSGDVTLAPTAVR